MLFSSKRNRPLEIDDFRRLAKKRLPKMFYDYINSGSYSEQTYRANREDFQKILLRQFVARDVSKRSFSSTMLGRKYALPIGIAPTGLTGMMWPDGEIEAVLAAAQCGIPYTLSTMSICSMEEVAQKTQLPFWFQLYVMRDRKVTYSLIERAEQIGCPVLCVTVDLAVCGQRHQDIRNGLSVPPAITGHIMADIMRHPKWLLSMLRTKNHRFGNLMGHIKGLDTIKSLGAWVKNQFDSSVTWEDLKKIRDKWPGKLVIKGVLEASDIHQAARIGADGVIISNHGGRQLDGTSSTIAALARMKDLKKEKIEIYLDGGIRSGQDVIKALCLGANGVFIGRPFVNALASNGRKAAVSCLEILKSEMDVTMALSGVSSCNAYNRDHVYTNL